MTEPLPEGFVLWTQQKERLDRILELVSNGQSVAITGDYRSGKTTLLLAAEREIDKQPGRRAVYIDAARISDPEQLYLDIITAIIGSDAPDDFVKALRSRPTRDVLQDPISKLRLTGEEVTICLDEVSQSLENLDKKHALELSLLIQASAEQTGITYIIALSQSINQRLEPEFAKTLSRFEKIQVHSIRKGTLNYTNNDRPSGTDRLNFREYVTALSKLVSSEHTAPPLTVGIYGPWGSGKSFLMRKLRQELEDNTRYQFEFLTIDLGVFQMS